jgi:O-antigen/teichoic acid export membrane protein
MKIAVLNYINQRIRDAHPRTRKLQLNTLIGISAKGVGMLISLLLVPLTIDYLSKETYGTWLTISSIVTMLSFFDIGIGNGLRNKLSVAISKQEITTARSYISTAYVLFGGLQVLIISVFCLIYRWIPWQKIFNTSINEVLLEDIVLILVVSMALKLILDLLIYMLMAIQESGLASLLTLTTNVITLVGTFILTKFAAGNLLYLAILTTFSPILVLLIGSLVFFSTKLKAYRPILSSINWHNAKGLLSLGYQFFFIQIAVIILFYTDNVIISQLFGPVAVTTYNISFRYFNIASTIFLIITTPFWSAFTEAHAKNDLGWMKKALQRLQMIWFGFAVLIIFMVIFSDYAYMLWIGKRVKVPFTLTLCMSFFVLVTTWNNTVVTVANGLGKVKLQLIYALAAAAVNIPLAILLGSKLGLNSSGVILASSISLLIGSFFGTLQAKKLLSGTATGIWNK